jgi:hypothetical protein
MAFRGGGNRGGAKQYDNAMRGVLFDNKDARNKNDPDLRGSCEVDGVEYWVAAWWKKSDKVDGDFLSMAFTLKEERGEQRRDSGRRESYGPGNRPGNNRSSRGRDEPRPDRGRDGGFDEMDDDVPF